MTHESAGVSSFHPKMLTHEFSSPTEDLPSVCVERASLRADIEEMKVLLQRMKNDVKTSLSNLSSVLQNTYEDIFEADKFKIKEILANEWKKMKTHFWLCIPV